uniref:PKD domain-containing protein n=1 Tax=uncultured Draconibacterium sp. TaxID=1573823 RepID=UPI003217F40F
MRKLILFTISIIGIFLFHSCDDETSKPTFPISAEIFYSIDGKQVAFTALTHSAVSWSWDFGDGNTSTDKDPVYVYTDGGYYIAKLTATDKAGNTATSEVNLAVALTPYALLTGDHTQPGYDGKTWKMSQGHSSNDKLVNSDAELTLFDEGIQSLPTGAFDLYLGLKEAYNDEYTFYFDGSFKHNTIDGSSFGGIVYAMIMQQLGLTTITKTGGEAVFGQDAFALTTYTPENNATFILTESEAYSVPTIPAFATGVDSNGIPIVTYSNVMTIDFPNSSEFIAARDFFPKVMVEEITDNSMRLVVFLTMSPDAVLNINPLIVLSTTALILTFEVVN